jgi:hypothetical protein
VSSNRLKQRPHKAGENRLLFGIPLTEHLFSAFFRKWLDLRIDPDRVFTMGGIYLPDAHNRMIEWALQRRDWDALVWMEHDHTLLPYFIRRLESYPESAMVVGVLYFGRSARDPWPMAGMWEPKPAHDFEASPQSGNCIHCDKPPSAPRPHPAVPFGMRYLKPSELIPMLEEMGLYAVDFVPSGFTFIRREVLEKWAPYLKPIYYTIPDNEETVGAGDDVRFAKLAQEQGHEILLDTWCPVDEKTGEHLDLRHLTSFELGRDYYWDRIKLRHLEALVLELEKTHPELLDQAARTLLRVSRGDVSRGDASPKSNGRR